MTASLPVSETPRLVTIDEIVHVLSHRPTATTRARDWAGVTVDMYAPLPNISERYPALDHHLICYCPTGNARLVQGRDGKVHESLISPGVSMLMRPSRFGPIQRTVDQTIQRQRAGAERHDRNGQRRPVEMEIRPAIGKH